MGFTKGDHIKAMRMGYAHHGIYMGNGRVLHYLDEEGVCECSLEEFAAGMPVDTVSYLLLDTFGPDEVARRASSRVGESEYSLVFKNCEHFATWCACGLEHSGQVQRAAAAVAGVGAFAVKRVAAGVAGRAAGGAVLGGAVTAKAAGAGTAAKLGAVGLGTAGVVSAPVLLGLGAVLLVSAGFAWLLSED